MLRLEALFPLVFRGPYVGVWYVDLPTGVNGRGILTL